MVKLTRIYTKTGDDGTTSLGDMSRTSKTDPRLEAYATVDEANSYIGIITALGENNVDKEILEILSYVQNDLFDVGADLCVLIRDGESGNLRVTEKQITYIETYIDIFNKNLDPLTDRKSTRLNSSH